MAGNVFTVRVALSTPGTPGPPPRGAPTTGGTGSRTGHRDDRPHGGDHRSAPGDEADGPTGRLGNRGDEVVEGDRGDPLSEGGTDNFLAEKERRLGPGWRSKPAGAVLAQPSSASTAGTTEDGHGDDRVPAIDAERDPVALEIREWASLQAGYAATARGLFEKPERYKEWDIPRFTGWWPAGPREMQEHLRRLAPALLEAGILAEYWEKGGAQVGATDAAEGFWIFMPAEGGVATKEQVEERVWPRVAYLEGIESILDTFMDEI